MKVFIYSGIPGSGKTTLARRRHPSAVILSADDFFTKAGVYSFDPKLIGEAHASCIRRFVGFVSHETHGMTELVVDNTNTTIAELAPYAATALAFGHEIQIVTLHCPISIAHKRNVHGVSLETVMTLYAQIGARELPPWWPSTDLAGDIS